MRSSKVNTGDTGFASQYNNLRSDVQGSGSLLAHEQAVPNMTLKVQNGVYYIEKTKIIFAGGNSPTFTAPTTNPRIDLLVIDTNGALSIVQGTEAASPSAPAQPSGKVTIVEVFNRVAETSIKDADDAVNGYILNDVRPFISAPFAAGSAKAKFSTIFEDTARFPKTVVGSGAVTIPDSAGVQGAKFDTGVTASSKAEANLENPANSIAPVWDLDPEVHMLASVLSTQVNQEGFFGLGLINLIAGGGSTFVGRHTGFRFDGSTIYATNADGTTETATAISVTLDDAHFWSAIMISGASIKFYVDGVLKATHTTNLPSGATQANLGRWGIGNKATAASYLLRVWQHTYGIKYA